MNLLFCHSSESQKNEKEERMSSVPSLQTLLNDEEALSMISYLLVMAVAIFNAVVQWRHTHNEYTEADLDHLCVAFYVIGGISAAIGMMLILSGLSYGFLPFALSLMAFGEVAVLKYVEPKDAKMYIAIGYTVLAVVMAIVVMYTAYQRHQSISPSTSS